MRKCYVIKYRTIIKYKYMPYNKMLDNKTKYNKVLRCNINIYRNNCRYNKLSRDIRELGKKIKEVEPDHPFRIEQSARLLEKLYMMGLISTKWDLSQTQKVTASCFCRRRLPVVMVRNKMSQTISMATKFIEQGHVRVGVEVIKDPAFLVTR